MASETRGPPSSVLTAALLINGSIAFLVALADAVLLALLLEHPDSARYPEAEIMVTAFVLAILLAPGYLLFSAFLSCASWLWHALSESDRPVFVDAVFGLVGGAILGFSYVAQDVMGVRPETTSELLGRNVIVVLCTSFVFGGGLGFISGGIARWRSAEARAAGAGGSRVLAVINGALVFATALPGLALLFTFAHFTGRTDGWEILATPFVYVLALMTILGAGVPFLLVLCVIVATHRTLLGGKGTFVLESVIALGIASVALLIGVSLFDSGMDNFRDLLSFAVAASAGLFFATLVGAVLGIGWGVTES